MIGFVLSPQAQVDLRKIRDWIMKDNPARAVTFVEEFIARFSTLTEHPMLGRSRPELGDGVRVLVHESDLIAYRIADDRILIARVIHGRRDLSRHFAGR